MTNSTRTGKTNIFLVEDHTAFRQSLSKLLNGHGQFNCKSFSIAEEAIKALDIENPELVLMDINLTGISGIEATRIIRSKYPAVQVMMCTVYEDDTKIFEALKAGANGYLLKRSGFDDIFKSINDLLDGGSPMSNRIARKVVAAFRFEGQAIKSEPLTGRENEILELLAKSRSIKDIAYQLNITYNTIRTHIRHIYENYRYVPGLKLLMP